MRIENEKCKSREALERVQISLPVMIWVYQMRLNRGVSTLWFTVGVSIRTVLMHTVLHRLGLTKKEQCVNIL